MNLIKIMNISNDLWLCLHSPRAGEINSTIGIGIISSVVNVQRRVHKQHILDLFLEGVQLTSHLPGRDPEHEAQKITVSQHVDLE